MSGISTLKYFICGDIRSLGIGCMLYVTKKIIWMKMKYGVYFYALLFWNYSVYVVYLFLYYVSSCKFNCRFKCDTDNDCGDGSDEGEFCGKFIGNIICIFYYGCFPHVFLYKMLMFNFAWIWMYQMDRDMHTE